MIVELEVTEIKAIIFDWGGVLIDDPAPLLVQYCADALGVSQADYLYAFTKYHDDFQKGLLTEERALVNICGELKVAPPKVDSLWYDAFSCVSRIKPEVFKLVEYLKTSGFKTAFLSNTEIPAVQFFRDQRYTMFDVTIFSCYEGIAKPERKIYEIALEKLRTEPRQSVFVDDKIENVNGARDVGMQGIVFENIDQLKTELSRLGIGTG